jgi:hypothetical protein
MRKSAAKPATFFRCAACRIRGGQVPCVLNRAGECESRKFRAAESNKSRLHAEHASGFERGVGPELRRAADRIEQVQCAPAITRADIAEVRLAIVEKRTRVANDVHAPPTARVAKLFWAVSWSGIAAVKKREKREADDVFVNCADRQREQDLAFCYALPHEHGGADFIGSGCEKPVCMAQPRKPVCMLNVFRLSPPIPLADQHCSQTHPGKCE